MRIRFNRNSYSAYGNFNIKAVVDLPDEVARRYCETGAATEIKVEKVRAIKPKVAETKPEVHKAHKHSYRKDGTCACGAVRKAKKA